MKMQERCPDAVPLGKFMLMNARLVFRMVADVIPEEGSFVLGALYKISEEDRDSLDGFEGVAAGIYERRFVELPGLPDGETQIILYTMRSTGICPPPYAYLERIKRGYRDHGLSLGALNAAVERAHDEKHLSHVERRRMRRTGRPVFAMRPSLKVVAKVEEKKKGGKKAKRHDKSTGKNRPKHRDHWAHATPDMMRRKVTNLSEYLADRQSGGYRH